MTDAVPADAPTETPGFDVRAFRRALGQFATGVTIVTCLDADGAPTGMTANSFSSVSLDPPLVLWSLDRRAKGFEAYANADRFAVSILSVDQTELSNRFARSGGDKFAGLDWPAGEGGVPLVPEAAARFECATERRLDGGDHVIILGRVTAFERTERPVLVFAQGSYGAVAPHPSTGGLQALGNGARADDTLLLPLLYRAYDRLLGGFSQSLTEGGATESQMRVLAILEASGGEASRETLVRASLLSRARFDSAGQALANRGDVTGADRLALAPQGRARLGDLVSLAAAHEAEAMPELEETERDALRALLRRVAVRDA